jgi:two-component system, NarL family, invasion response regulator UvrY
LPIKVLLADNSEVIHCAIERHLKFEPKIKMVGQTKTFEEAVRLVRELSPDVVILDLRMTADVSDDNEGIRQICECWVIAMSVSVDDETDALFGKLNADAFIDKMDLGEKLIPTILELAGREV